MLVILHYLGYHYQSTRNQPLHFPFLPNAVCRGVTWDKGVLNFVYLQVSTVNVVFLLLFSLSTVLELCTVIVVLEAEVRWDIFTSSCV